MATEYGIVVIKRPWYKKKRFLIPLAIVGLVFVIGVFSPDGEDAEVASATPSAVASGSPKSATTTESPSAEPTGPTAEEVAAQAEAERVAAEQEAAEEAARVEAERVAAEQAAAAAAAEEAASGTVSQQNAYASAKSYLGFKGFSRASLIQQLTSEFGEGFPAADAEFAVARLEAAGGVDWNAEAAEAAKSYLEFTSFSRSGLIEQLTSEFGEGFTQEQAEYGVSQTGL